MGSNDHRRRKKPKQQPRPHASDERSPMLSTYSPLTPEGQIEGTGRFAEGLEQSLRTGIGTVR